MSPRTSVSSSSSTMGKQSPDSSLHEYPLKDLDANSEQEGLLYDGYQAGVHKKRLPRIRKALPWLGHLMLLTISVTLFILAYLVKPHCSEAVCTRVLSPYSPALEAVEYYDVTWEASFTSTSIYRGPPSPERDAAWEYLTHDGGVDVPFNELPKLNKSQDIDWQRTDPKLGMGDGAVGMLEVFHELHCLNVLRKWTYIEWYDEDNLPAELDGPDHMVRMHLDHCVEIIRMSLMCSADVTPLLAINEADSPLGRVGDFNTFHRCRNFDKIKNWMTDHIVVP